MQLKKWVLYGVALAVSLLVFAASPARAVDGATSISVSPVTFDLSANPGDTVTNEILIRNSSSNALTISAQAEDFVASGEEGDVTLTDQKSTYSLSSWIQLDSTPFTLNAGQQRTVKFMIVVPYNAEPGGHYASVYAQISPTLNSAKSGSGVGQKIGSLILLNVAGNATESAKLDTFNASKYSYEKGPVEFDIRIANTGSVHLKPKGIISVTDMWGKKVADITVEQKNILPGAIRHTVATWNKPPVFGKYSATFLALYGSNNQQVSGVVTFWIIPWKLLLIWGAVLVALVVFLWLGRKRLADAFKALLGKK